MNIMHALPASAPNIRYRKIVGKFKVRSAAYLLKSGQTHCPVVFHAAASLRRRVKTCANETHGGKSADNVSSVGGK
jgi:hypothetical protein